MGGHTFGLCTKPQERKRVESRAEMVLVMKKYEEKGMISLEGL